VRIVSHTVIREQSPSTYVRIGRGEDICEVDARSWKTLGEEEAPIDIPSYIRQEEEESNHCKGALC
jgi:hypothetical protein